MLSTDFITLDDTRIRYAVSEGTAKQTILLTSPWPESVYAFTPIWRTLAERFRLVAVDLPGFGRSEGNLGPETMGGFLALFVEHLGLERPLVLAPDVGTPAALFMAAARPELTSGLVVGSGGVAWPIQLTGPLAEWVFAPDLDHYRTIDPDVFVNAALGTIAGYDVPDEIRTDYLESYSGDRFVESMKYARHYPEDLPKLAALLPTITTPVQIIAGANDRVVPMANHTYLDERLPNSELTVLDSGHFVWEEAPAEYAAIVTAAITVTA